MAAWQDDVALQMALSSLPQALARAAHEDWSAALPVLKDADRLLVVGRGLGLPAALEVALKFKETCGIQAEAFSGAEVQHGPMALVGAGYPVLVLAPRGPAQAGLLELADALRARGARVLLAAPGAHAAHQPADHGNRRRGAGPHLDPAKLLPHGGGAVPRARAGPGPAAPPGQGDAHALKRQASPSGRGGSKACTRYSGRSLVSMKTRPRYSPSTPMQNSWTPPKKSMVTIRLG